VKLRGNLALNEDRVVLFVNKLQPLVALMQFTAASNSAQSQHGNNHEGP